MLADGCHQDGMWSAEEWRRRTWSRIRVGTQSGTLFVSGRPDVVKVYAF